MCSSMNKAYLFRFYGAGTILCSFVPVIKAAKAYNDQIDTGSYFFIAKLMVCADISIAHSCHTPVEVIFFLYAYHCSREDVTLWY